MDRQKPSAKARALSRPVYRQGIGKWQNVRCRRPTRARRACSASFITISPAITRISFGRDGNIFARANRGQRGLQTRRSDNGDQHNVRFGHCCEFDQAFVTGINLGHPRPMVPCRNAVRPFLGSKRRDTASGQWRKVCLASKSTWLPAPSPISRILSGKSSATLTVLVPMEPVEPSRTTFFMDESARDANTNTSGVH